MLVISSSQPETPPDKPVASFRFFTVGQLVVQAPNPKIARTFNWIFDIVSTVEGSFNSNGASLGICYRVFVDRSRVDEGGSELTRRDRFITLPIYKTGRSNATRFFLACGRYRRFYLRGPLRRC